MDIRYIELKTGYNDNGPAWIGNVKESKSGKTIYFNDHAFQKYHGVYLYHKQMNRICGGVIDGRLWLKR